MFRICNWEIVIWRSSLLERSTITMIIRLEWSKVCSIMSNCLSLSYQAVSLPCFLLQHHNSVRTLVQGRWQALPLCIQCLDPPLEIRLPLRHDVDLLPQCLQDLDVVWHARLLVPNLVPHWLQLNCQRFFRLWALKIIVLIVTCYRILPGDLHLSAGLSASGSAHWAGWSADFSPSPPVCCWSQSAAAHSSARWCPSGTPSPWARTPPRPPPASCAGGTSPALAPEKRSHN